MALDSSNAKLSKEAVFWISQHDEESAALDALEQIYDSRKDFATREKLIFSISQIETEEAARFLLNIANNEKIKELREKALFWLAQTESDVAFEYFEKIIEQ